MSSSAITTQVAQLKAGNIQNQADSTSIYSSGQWSFKNSTAVASVTITDAGNVGIGTASPAARLDIQSANQALNPVQVRFNTSNELLGFGIANSNGFPYIGYNTKSAVGTDIPTYERSSFATQFRMDNGEFKFSTAASGTAGNAITFAERMRIDASGLIIPGTPINTSTIASALTGRLSFTEGGVPGSQVATAIHWQTVQTAGNSGFRQHVSLGSVRSGGPDFGYMFIGVGQNDSAITTAFNFYGNGSAIQGNNSSTWSVASDARIKQNVRPVSSCLQKITALNPVHFEYIHKPEQIKTGFVAQEFEQVLPGHVLEAVCPLEVAELKPELKEEKIKAIDADLIPYLVGAIKELSAKVNAQAAEIEALKAK